MFAYLIIVLVLCKSEELDSKESYNAQSIHTQRRACNVPSIFLLYPKHLQFMQRPGASQANSYICKVRGAFLFWNRNCLDSMALRRQWQCTLEECNTNKSVY
jgi:hypothetical protein